MRTIIGPVDPVTAAWVAVIATAVTMLCVAPLCIATWRHQAHPPVVTWAIWAPIGLSAALGSYLGGAPITTWLIKLGLSVGPIAVVIVGLLRGEPFIASRLDRWCVAFGGAGIVAYVLVYFGAIGPADPVAAGLIVVGVAILVDCIGAGPTWRKAWRERGTLAEVATFALALASVVAGLATLPLPWTLLSSSNLLFLAAQMASIIAVLLAGRARKRLDARPGPAERRESIPRSA